MLRLPLIQCMSLLSSAVDLDYAEAYLCLHSITNAGASVAGQPGAVGYYNFGINSWQEVICFNIT